MFNTTIESVLSSITKKISQLRTLSSEHHNNHLIHVEESIRHTDVAAQEAFNRDKASRIADKFEELLR